MKVVIAGGGIVGLCCAYYLNKEGYEVTVIDKASITTGASFGNAGYVSPSHFIPLASPGIIAKGLRWMLSSSSPFYIKPRLDGDLIKWCFTFWKNANAKTVEKNARPLFDLLAFSRELTCEIRNDLGNSFRMKEQGCFMLFQSPHTEKHEIELAEEGKKYGLKTRYYNAAQLQEAEPHVKVNARGGVLYEIDAHLHPGDLMKTIYDHLLKKGVEFKLNTSITSFEYDEGKISKVITDKGDIFCDEFVLAAGSWTPVISRFLGIEIMLQAGKGYSMTFEKVERNLCYPAILVDHRVAMTPMGDDLRMGGTMEISGLESPLLIKRAEAIFKAAKLYYPDLPVQFPERDHIWSGLRPLSPDGLPYIGRHKKYSNLTIATGHAMLGLSLAAGTGRVVEEIISHKKPSVGLESFYVDRFNHAGAGRFRIPNRW